MDESLHDALDAIAFLLAVIAAAALAAVTLQYGPVGPAFTVLFLFVLTVIGSAAGLIPDRDRMIDADPAAGEGPDTGDAP
ncbi:hypothetical protein JCM17823_20760 [Halorubrum gandharaense]